MDQIKEAFNKVKQDIYDLKIEINSIKKELEEIQTSILNLTKLNSTLNIEVQTLRQTNSTHKVTSTDTSTDILPFQALKRQNIKNSIGNEGVSTDRQTIRQTDKLSEKGNLSTLIINQIDGLRQELKDKIKSLTNQEMLVFSTIYQYDNNQTTIDYHFLATKLSLSQSSIRDYVQRILNKGAPLIKTKENNKHIILHIPDDFKKLASLDTILLLRESK
ncbi:MAG: hypothetical protein QXI33_00425 [Candidatus Pacearchaeota archaeon]